MSFFYPDQAYPGDDPLAVARSMGIRPEEAMQLMMGGRGGPPGMGGGPSGMMGGPMGGGFQQPDYDPNLLAEMVGQQYNPYQGYPTKQVSDQVWDVMGPTPEYLLPQIYNLQNPDAGQQDLDAFFQANPTIQGPFAEAYTQAEGDPIKTYAALQNKEPTETTNAKGETVMQPSIQDRFRKEVGRSEWADLAEQGYMPIIQAANRGSSPEEMDKIANDYYMGELEGLLAGGAPTSQRAEREFDYTRQREGFRPAPGTGAERPPFEGPGFGGAPDPLADLAGSSQYGGMDSGGMGGQVVREDEGGFWVRPSGGSAESHNEVWKRAADLIRSGGYKQGRNGGGSRRQDANGGGSTGGGGGRGFNMLNLANFTFAGPSIAAARGGMAGWRALRGSGSRRPVQYSQRSPSQSWQGLSSRRR